MGSNAEKSNQHGWVYFQDENSAKRAAEAINRSVLDLPEGNGIHAQFGSLVSIDNLIYGQRSEFVKNLRV